MAKLSKGDVLVENGETHKIPSMNSIIIVGDMKLENGVIQYLVSSYPGEIPGMSTWQSETLTPDDKIYGIVVHYTWHSEHDIFQSYRLATDKESKIYKLILIKY